MNSRDKVFVEFQDGVESFVFDKNVVNVFPDMIKRSAPGYLTLVSTIGVIAADFAQNNSNIYDLGCSLGAVSASINSNLDKLNCKIIAVDNSDDMIEACQKNLAKCANLAKIDIINTDIRKLKIENASVVALNYTLQFIPVEDRELLLKKIFDGLLPGGVLILSEKIIANSAKEQNIINSLHLKFKKANGYSDLEIAGKRSALENVLIPETFKVHKKRLLKVGFTDVFHFFQCLNFHSILAIKGKND